MPKPFKNSAREIVLKVRAFCEREKANQAPLIRLDQVRARVAAMTGMSEKTVSRITKEGEVAASTSQKLKSRVASNNVSQEAGNIVKLTEEAFSSITPQDWQKQCEHINHLEDKFYERDGCMDNITDKFIIELGNDSSTDSDTSNDAYASDSLESFLSTIITVSKNEINK
ncbi:uncharacterized protein LOC114244599 [Bombyx mandarina]|uniref:Uncharacterized protein LOC114244599 n=1 Tax=Bombyx mandarina TaxID=7092 RepID=A0A6J2JSK9_BOMMA|nr:uncharacterized protein LOC114244599 [Bombyx mandarina]